MLMIRFSCFSFLIRSNARTNWLYLLACWNNKMEWNGMHWCGAFWCAWACADILQELINSDVLLYKLSPHRVWPFMIGCLFFFALCTHCAIHAHANRSWQTCYGWNIFIFHFIRFICSCWMTTVIDHINYSIKEHFIGIRWTHQRHSIIRYCGLPSLTNTLWTTIWIFLFHTIR